MTFAMFSRRSGVVAAAVLLALGLAVPFVARDRGAGVPPPAVTEEAATPLGPLSAPIEGQEAPAFTDGRNHFVVDLPGATATPSTRTLLGEGDRLELGDRPRLDGVEDIVTDAEGRPWLVHDPRETATASAEIPDAL